VARLPGSRRSCRPRSLAGNAGSGKNAGSGEGEGSQKPKRPRRTNKDRGDREVKLSVPVRPGRDLTSQVRRE